MKLFRGPNTQLIVMLAFSVSSQATFSMQADVSIGNPVSNEIKTNQSNWNGIYIGGSGGWAWSSLHVSANPFGSIATQSTSPTNFSSSNFNGGVFTGQLGFNRSIGKVTLGIEGDVSDVNLNDSKATTPTNPIRVINNYANALNGFMLEQKVDWLTSIRGRIGTTWQAGLLYFTAGGAWKRVSTTTMYTFNGEPDLGSNIESGPSVIKGFRNTNAGYVVGAGYEWLIKEHFTLKGEYLYFGFDNHNTYILTYDDKLRPGLDGNGVKMSMKNGNINLIRLGVNYQFG